MKLLEIINMVDELKPNIIPQKVKVRWLSRVDGRVCNEVIRVFKKYDIQLEDSKTVYELPSTIRSYDVLKGYYNNSIYYKITPLENSGFYIAKNDESVECLHIINWIPKDGDIFTLEYQERNPSYDIDNDVELLIPEPYDTVYEHYLKAMIDKENEDYEGYQNNMQFFNVEFEEFATWYIQRQPQRKRKIRNVW